MRLVWFGLVWFGLSCFALLCFALAHFVLFLHLLCFALLCFALFVAFCLFCRVCVRVCFVVFLVVCYLLRSSCLLWLFSFVFSHTAVTDHVHVTPSVPSFLSLRRHMNFPAEIPPGVPGDESSRRGPAPKGHGAASS